MTSTFEIITKTALTSCFALAGALTLSFGCDVETEDELELELRGGSSGFCGGIAGIECPAGQECVDDPSDDCNPEKGGADCGGICVGPQPCGGFGGFECEGKGEVCVDVPSDGCDPDHGGNDCAGICVDPVPCGGFGGFECEGEDEVCVDDPRDECDPGNGGNDCGGLCAPDLGA